MQPSSTALIYRKYSHTISCYIIGTYSSILSNKILKTLLHSWYIYIFGNNPTSRYLALWRLNSGQCSQTSGSEAGTRKLWLHRTPEFHRQLQTDRIFGVQVTNLSAQKQITNHPQWNVDIKHGDTENGNTRKINPKWQRFPRKCTNVT